MPRSVAFDLLKVVLVNKRPLDDVLQSHAGFARLQARDRAFARNLISTTLRRLGQIDVLIDHCLQRRLPLKARDVRHLLRLGFCQLLFLRTPPHAAIDTMVDLAQARGHGPHKGLINAILRRMSREGASLVENQNPARLNTPEWLWSSWNEAYGKKTARAIAEAHLNEPPLDLTAKADSGALAETLGAEILPGGSLRLKPQGPITELAGFEAGDWWVQDAAAALPARLFGDVSGKTVIDLCAAPGGKTAQLAAAGARVIAVDRSEKRLRRLRENLQRLGLQAETVAADAEQWSPPEPADAVLLDAPCSATGTIRRHPDIAWLKTPGDIDKLSVLQARLLQAALAMVKPGGMLIYCTCSLQPEECEQQIAAFLQENDAVRRQPLSESDLPGLDKVIMSTGDLRTLPSHLASLGGMDGFYAARMVRL